MWHRDNRLGSRDFSLNRLGRRDFSLNRGLRLGLHFLVRWWFPEWPNCDHRNGETYAQNNRHHRRWASGAAPHFVHTVCICLVASLGMLIHSRSYQILTALKGSDDAALDSDAPFEIGVPIPFSFSLVKP